MSLKGLRVRVGGLLEGLVDGDEVLAVAFDLVDHVLDTDDALVAEGGLDDLVGFERGALLVDVHVAAFEDQRGDGLFVRDAEGHVLLNPAQKSLAFLIHVHKHRCKQLPQPEQLKNPLHLLRRLSNRPDPNNQQQLPLGNWIFRRMRIFLFKSAIEKIRVFCSGRRTSV